MSPGFAPSGTGTVTSPVVSSTFTPSGAPSPGVNFVSSGAEVSLPSLSLNVGAGTVTSSPGLPDPSSYTGSKSRFWFGDFGLVPPSFSLSSGMPSPSSSVSSMSDLPSPSVSSWNFASASSVEPSGYVTVTGTSNSSTVSALSLDLSGNVTVISPVFSSIVTS